MIRTLRVLAVAGLFATIVLNAPALAYQSSLSLSAGYRTDSLDWNIAGNFDGTNPNILSELTWDDLQSFQIAAEAEITHPLKQRIGLVLLGRAAYGWIVSGDNQDSDYAGDNRTLEWSRSNNDAGDGHVFDLEGGIGLRYALRDGQWQLTPNVGYAYFEQDLVMRDGYQTVSVDLSPTYPVPPPVGPFPGLDSSYLAWWSGPWLGLQAAWQYHDNLQYDLSLRWHRVDFHAEADWNLRSDLQHPVSFEHEASGDGFSLQVGADYRLREEWRLVFAANVMDLQAENGLDIVYLSDGTVAGTRLNEVNWDSWSYSLGLQHSF